ADATATVGPVNVMDFSFNTIEMGAEGEWVDIDELRIGTTFDAVAPRANGAVPTATVTATATASPSAIAISSDTPTPTFSSIPTSTLRNTPTPTLTANLGPTTTPLCASGI